MSAQYYGRFTRGEWNIIAHARKTLGEEVANQIREIYLSCKTWKCYPSTKSEWVSFSDDEGETCYQKRFLPYHLTDEEWEEEMQNDSISAPNSPYDCTGAIFTSWVERFEISNGTWIYRRLCRDV